jgi:hypothetical protein
LRKKLTEKEIDERVTKQADDDSAWEHPITVTPVRGKDSRAVESDEATRVDLINGLRNGERSGFVDDFDRDSFQKDIRQDYI